MGETMPDGHPWPRVSIITPSYNQGQFIEETIRSVLLQGYPDLEYIIIDGGSTDRSLEIIKKYKRWLSYWVSEPDQGQAHAINKGWERVSGAVLAYLNSDDLYSTGAVSRVVEFLRTRPDVGIVYGSFTVIDASSCVKALRVSPPAFSLPKILLGNTIVPQPTAFLRKEVLERAGAIDSSLHYCMDYEFWIRAALKGVWFARLPGSPLACFRDWAGNKSTRGGSGDSLREALSVIARVYSCEDFPSSMRGKEDKARASLYMQVASDWYWRGEMQQARRFLLSAVKIYRPIICDPAFVCLLGKTALGHKGRSMTRRLKRFITQHQAH